MKRIELTILGLLLILATTVQSIALQVYESFLGIQIQNLQFFYEFILLFLLNIIIGFSINLFRVKREERRLSVVLEANREKMETLTYVSALGKFKSSLLSMNDPSKIAKNIEDFIVTSFQTSGCSVYLWNEEKGAFTPRTNQTSEIQSTFYLYDPIILWLADFDRPILFNEVNESRLENAPPEIRDVFILNQLDILLPLILNSSVIGMIFINKKLGNRVFRMEEIERLNELKTVSVMSLSNATFYEKLISITENLELKVKERTRELEDTQSQLIMSEKMASLGIMVAGIAHEINTPAGVISNSTDNIEKSTQFLYKNISLVQVLYTNPDLVNKLEILIQAFLKDINLKGIDSKEKFRIRKNLREVIKSKNIPEDLIEEVSNFIIDRNYSDYQDTIIELVAVGGKEAYEFIKHLSGVRRNVSHIQYAIKNIIRIVRALKHYSHLDQAAQEESDLVEGIENTLIIMSNQLKHGIEIIKSYENIPLVRCNPDELNQVWTNLIQNAVHAMKGEGTLQILVRKLNEQEVVVEIIDSGCGIPQKIIEKIWDPFFTTKDQGQGSGLGLGIVKGIIEKHKGKILVESQPGETKFQIILPILQTDPVI